MNLEEQQAGVWEADCLNRHILDTVVNKWSSLIFYALSQKPRRYNELRGQIEGISQTMLTNTLRRLERDGLVHREIYPVIPPKVEYSLTPLSQTLIPIFEQIYEWAGKHQGEIEQAQALYDQQK
ncbi:MAG: helix-turn-helix domain-containing protein [Caldilineaceae bacterium]